MLQYGRMAISVRDFLESQVVAAKLAAADNISFEEATRRIAEEKKAQREAEAKQRVELLKGVAEMANKISM